MCVAEDQDVTPALRGAEIPCTAYAQTCRGPNQSHMLETFLGNKKVTTPIGGLIVYNDDLFRGLQ